MVIWLIGLSGAGKTTLGLPLYEKLKPSHKNLVFLDGDILREVWGDSPGHDIEGRGVNARRISSLCHMLDRQGIHVITAILSIFPEWQAWNRENFSRYFEIFLDTPLEVVKERDAKGLYSKAASGEIKSVVGVDIPFPKPKNPDLVLAPPEVLRDPEYLVNRILETLPALEE